MAGGVRGTITEVASESSCRRTGRCDWLRHFFAVFFLLAHRGIVIIYFFT
jgi:hypothetical protein